MPRFLLFVALSLVASPAWASSSYRTPLYVPGTIKGYFFLFCLGVAFVGALCFALKLMLGKQGVNEMLAALEPTDPAWDIQTMLPRVHAVFSQVQDAWAKRDLSLAEGAVSPALMLTLKARLGALELAEMQNVVERVKLHDAQIYQLTDRLDDARDSFRVLLNYQAVDFKVSMATNMLSPKSNDTNLRAFTQTWRFARSGNTWVADKIEQDDVDVYFAEPSVSETLNNPSGMGH